MSWVAASVIMAGRSAGIVLPVTVHGGDERRARRGEAGRERGALPEVAREAHGHDARRVGGVQAPQVIPRAVGAAVVHEDQLVVQAGRRRGRPRPLRPAPRRCRPRRAAARRATGPAAQALRRPSAARANQAMATVTISAAAIDRADERSVRLASAPSRRRRSRSPACPESGSGRRGPPPRRGRTSPGARRRCPHRARTA